MLYTIADDDYQNIKSYMQNGVNAITVDTASSISYVAYYYWSSWYKLKTTFTFQGTLQSAENLVYAALVCNTGNTSASSTTAWYELMCSLSPFTANGGVNIKETTFHGLTFYMYAVSAYDGANTYSHFSRTDIYNNTIQKYTQDQTAQYAAQEAAYIILGGAGAIPTSTPTVLFNGDESNDLYTYENGIWQPHNAGYIWNGTSFENVWKKS